MTPRPGDLLVDEAGFWGIVLEDGGVAWLDGRRDEDWREYSLAHRLGEPDDIAFWNV